MNQRGSILSYLDRGLSKISEAARYAKPSDCRASNTPTCAVADEDGQAV
jgi:hypothetical protein